MNKSHYGLGLALLALSTAACSPRDIRAEQRAECAAKGGQYHNGEDADDDVCVISRGDIIMFDDREPDDE